MTAFRIDQLILLAELFYERGNNHEFMSLVKELAPPGDLAGSTTFPFEFQNVEKQHETYSGINARLRCDEPISAICAESAQLL